MQRFISEDPIGFLGGDINLYAYLNNSAPNFTDPSGQILDTILDVIFIGWDLYNLATGSRKDLAVNLLMLGADIGAAFIPGVTGAGQGVKLMYAGEKRATQAAMHGPKTYQTYLKHNHQTGETYCGRTSGTGTPRENVANRDRGHSRNEEGFGPAVLDKSSTSSDAIRGREQDVIEFLRELGKGADQINGVSPRNPNRSRYRNASRRRFGKP